MYFDSEWSDSLDLKRKRSAAMSSGESCPWGANGIMLKYCELEQSLTG